MLSVFITPWENPTAIQRAIIRAVRSTTSAYHAGIAFARGELQQVREVVFDHVVGEAGHVLVAAA